MRLHDSRRYARRNGSIRALRWIGALSISTLLLGVPSLSNERGEEPLAILLAADAESEAALAEIRAEVMAALRAVRAGAGRGADDSARLRAYPLYPYLEAARLVHALETAEGPDADVDAASRAFLERHGDEPVTRAVRRARLESFARRKLWEALLAETDAGAGGEALRCATLQARIGVGDVEGIAPEIVDVWLTGRRLPLDCEPVFQWLRDEGLMTADLIEGRLRLLLENGNARFARVIASRLPA